MTTNHVKSIVDDFLTELRELDMPPSVIGSLQKLADSDRLAQRAELAAAIQARGPKEESGNGKSEDS